MTHQCNAYCRDGNHAAVVFSIPLPEEEAYAQLRKLARHVGVRFVAAYPAPEAVQTGRESHVFDTNNETHPARDEDRARTTQGWLLIWSRGAA